MEGFKVIPGYEDWCVTRNGKIYRVSDGSLIRAYKYGDRLFVSYPVGGERRLLAVHIAVALAWVENDDPVMKTVVNHIDGDPMNNWYENLEWTTHSGNNYHAVNTGLRSDNMPCKVRNFYTKEVKEFPSISQAASYMKLPRHTVADSLSPGKFGKLIAGQYEFRLLDDPEPFFYENRPEIISPSRYMVKVEESDGREIYIFNLKDLLRRYQLYRCPDGRSIPALVEHAKRLYPDKKFILRDAYSEARRSGSRKRILDKTMKKPVTVTKGDEVIEFGSMTEAARYFHVDRDVIKLRMSNPEATYLGWTFNGKPCFRET